MKSWERIFLLGSREVQWHTLSWESSFPASVFLKHKQKTPERGENESSWTFVPWLRVRDTESVSVTFGCLYVCHDKVSAKLFSCVSREEDSCSSRFLPSSFLTSLSSLFTSLRFSFDSVEPRLESPVCISLKVAKVPWISPVFNSFFREWTHSLRSLLCENIGCWRK